MRTVSFQSVLELVAQKANGKAELGAEEAVSVTTRINEYLRECWERDAWPEWCPVEQRYYRETWGSRAFSGGDEVYHADTDAYYHAEEDTVSGDIPGAGAPWFTVADWEENGGDPFRRYISLDQTQFGSTPTPIGTVLGLFQSDPRLKAGARRVDYTLTTEGIQVLRYSGTSVWVHFRKRPPEFTATVFDALRSYTAGERVYFVGTTEGFLDGECYECVTAATAGQSPQASPTKWSKIEFPYVLKHAVADFVFAELLEEDGQSDRAERRRSKAEETLATEWTKSEAQQGLVRTFRVLTRPGVESGAGACTDTTTVCNC